MTYPETGGVTSDNGCKARTPAPSALSFRCVELYRVEFAWILVGIFVFVGYSLEVITGFGGTIIALALGALLLPIDLLVPILVPLSMLLGLVMVWRHKGHIDRHLLLKLVLPGMAAGTALGYALKPWLNEAFMRPLFGTLIIWFAARELWRQMRVVASPVRAAWLTRTLTLFAGITHGLFASGGPLLVYALSGIQLDKARFRITLIVVWLALDTGLSIAFALDGRLQPALPMVLAYLPAMVVALWLGEYLHHKVSERIFRQAILVLLLICGTLLVIPRPA